MLTYYFEFNLIMYNIYLLFWASNGKIRILLKQFSMKFFSLMRRSAKCRGEFHLHFVAEPILTLGSIECITWPDNWTTVTADGSAAAQFEHTILITRTGAEILTRC